MNYIVSEVDLTEGSVVEVTLDKQANVLLLDHVNYSRYRAGDRYSYFGGLAKVSPFRIGAPSAGHCFVVVNLGGHGGSVRAAVRVLGG